MCHGSGNIGYGDRIEPDCGRRCDGVNQKDLPRAGIPRRIRHGVERGGSFALRGQVARQIEWVGVVIRLDGPCLDPSIEEEPRRGI